MDHYWHETLIELQNIIIEGSSVVAPNEFLDRGINVYKERVDFDSLRACKFFVIHKGTLDKHDIHALDSMSQKFFPQYANEVFVIYGPKKKNINENVSMHLKSFLEKLAHFQSKSIDKIKAPAKREIAYLGNNRAITRTVFGHKILLDTRDLSLAPHILLDGEWEAWITRVFLDLVKPGMNIVDIGSNVGFYSLLAADRVGKNGQLTCFEANPELASIVFHNLHLNGFHSRSKVINKAVYSHTDTLEFRIYENYMGSSSLWADEQHARTFHDNLNTINVQAIALDEYFSPGTKIDFIKIDAEGAEPYILKGATRVISDNPNITILMEFAPAIIQVSYGSIEEFFQDIKKLNLNMFRIYEDSSLKKMSFEEAETISNVDVVLKR